MLSKACNDEQYKLTYNYLNQLKNVDITTPQGSSTVDYVYDYDGIRPSTSLRTGWGKRLMGWM
jgi:hypothetical protein